MKTLSHQILLTLSLNRVELSALDLAAEIFRFRWEMENLADIRATCKDLQAQGKISARIVPFAITGDFVQVYARTGTSLAS